MTLRRAQQYPRRVAIRYLERHGGLERVLDLRRRLRGAADAAKGRIRSRRLAHRTGPGDRDGATVVPWRGRAVLAVARPSLAVHDLMVVNLDTVCDAFAEARIPHWICPTSATTFYRVGIFDDDRDAALDALVAAAPHVYIGAHEPGVPAVSAFTGSDTARRKVLAQDLWVVYANFADSTQQSVVGPEFACQVDVWSRDRHPVTNDLEWRTHEPNIMSMRLPDGFRLVEQPVVGDRDYPVVAGSNLRRHPTKIDFPVDVVYTWVNGNDPSWRERKEAAAAGLELRQLNPHAMNASRYIDREELRFSLRSLEAYADFVRHVWLVTDDQIPAWLDLSTDHLTIVTHKELFGDSGRLPTFNSHAIEARLHHIDGLAEHYLYMNDDFFFGNRVTAGSFFFRNGAWKYFPSQATMGPGAASPHDAPVDAAAKNGRDLIAERFGIEVTQKLKHVPHPQRRSVAFELENEFPAVFERVWASQFRGVDDVSTAASLIHHYGFATGRAFPATISSTYIEVSGHNLAGQLETVGRSGAFDAWCLNDETSDEATVEGQSRIVEESLGRILPLPSRYERRDGEAPACH